MAWHGFRVKISIQMEVSIQIICGGARAAAGLFAFGTGHPPRCWTQRTGIVRKRTTSSASVFTTAESVFAAARGRVRFICIAYQLQRSEEHTSELQSLRHLVCRL